MSTVAEQLKGAREARGLTVEQVADITKMRTDHVRALEQGDYKAFSAPVYIRGFVRTYSRLLKLDEAPLLAALEAELGREGRFSEETRPTHNKGLLDLLMLQLSKLDWRRGLLVATAVVCLAAAALGVVAWKKSRSENPLGALEPGVYRPATNLVEILPFRSR